MEPAGAFGSDDGDVRPLASLRAVVQRTRTAVGHERCDMCAVPLAAEHRHVVDVTDRALRCLCPHCHQLFDDPAAAQGRYRQIPRRVRSLGTVTIDDGQWDALQIPVGLAFFFTNSSIGRTMAFYPGPSGATESLLPLVAWDSLVDAHPDLATATPDVEALLVRRSPAGTTCHLVPIDLCYELVGRLRRTWVGFDGGREARLALDAFYARLEERAGG